MKPAYICSLQKERLKGMAVIVLNIVNLLYDDLGDHFR